MAEREYRDYSEYDLHELKRDLEKFQKQKIREKHASVDPDDTRRAGEHAVRLGWVLLAIEQEFSARQDERRSQREALAQAAVSQPQPQPPQARPQPQAFQPFRFTIPQLRPLFRLDGSSFEPIGHLEAWVFHLAIGQMNDGLIVERADGLRGLLIHTVDVRSI